MIAYNVLTSKHLVFRQFSDFGYTLTNTDIIENPISSDDDEEEEEEVGEEESSHVTKSQNLRLKKLDMDPQGILVDAPNYSAEKKCKWDSNR